MFPKQGLNPRPQQWKRQVLATGPPGNSPSLTSWSFPTTYTVMSPTLQIHTHTHTHKTFPWLPPHFSALLYEKSVGRWEQWGRCHGQWVCDRTCRMGENGLKVTTRGSSGAFFWEILHCQHSWWQTGWMIVYENRWTLENELKSDWLGFWRSFRNTLTN